MRAYTSWGEALGLEEAPGMQSPPVRTLAVALKLFLFIIAAAYTANLAAFFTQPNYVPSGPLSNVDLARRRNDTIACLTGGLALTFDAASLLNASNLNLQ